jgi:hypothetical protein
MLKAAGGLAAIAAAGVSAGLLDDDSRTRQQPGGLVLKTHETSDMASLELPVTDDSLSAAGSQRWRSDRLETTTYTMAAFIWPTGSRGSPSFRIRSRRGGAWGAWTTVPPMHDGQDEGTEVRSEHTGTELAWVGRSTAIQYEVSGPRPDGLRLVLLYPRPSRSDSTVESRLNGSISSRTAPAALEPSMFLRQDWGADETWRNGRPAYNHRMQQVHVHHTANANDYSSDQVPSLIRGIYRYHTHYLGWSDIAYNFLVDRFGGVWEGRAGGPELLVRGAHTRGFNSSSTGIAVIGNFDEVRPASSVLRSVAQIAAWKVHASGGWPRGRVRVRSEGSDLYDANDLVLLRVIAGHRDTNQTACPGRYLYNALPIIRRRAGKLIREAEVASQPVQILAPAAITGTASVGSQLLLQPGAYDPPDAALTIEWLRNGMEIVGATQTTYVVAPEDFGTQLSARVTATYEGRVQASQLSAMVGPVTAVPSAKVRIVGGPGSAQIKVNVQAPAGVAVSPAGDVEVSLGGRRRSVRLVDGRASARFKGLKPGRRRVSVRYSGADGLTSVEASGDVRIG